MKATTVVIAVIIAVGCIVATVGTGLVALYGKLALAVVSQSFCIITRKPSHLS